VLLSDGVVAHIAAGVAFPLPRYLEQWVRRKLRFFISY
jgi:hypothetical protein